MLQLHRLVWVTSNLAFGTLQDRLLQDKPFASRMIRYLETIIVQSIDLDIDGRLNSELEIVPPSAKNAETDHEFHVRLSIDGNTIA
jgi:hypothetical protein